MVYPSDLNDESIVRVVPERVGLELEQAKAALDQESAATSRLHAEVQRQLEEISKSIGELASRVVHLTLGGASRYKIYETLDSPVAAQSSTLEIDRDTGGLVLRIQRLEDVSTTINNMKVYGVGLPGNMTVKNIVPPTRPGDSPKVQLVRDDDNHANILAIFDRSPNTWFEWESVVIPPKQPLQQVGRAWIFGGTTNQDVKQVTKGLDWTIDVFNPGSEKPVENVPMVTFQDNPAPKDLARLKLEFELSDLRENVILDISPYLISNFPLVVEQIETSIDGVRWEQRVRQAGGMKIRGTEELARTLRVWLGRARWVRLHLRAGGWYQPRSGIGHDYLAAHIYERFEQRILGIRTKAENRYWWERHTVGKRAVGTIMIEEKTKAAETIQLVGFVAGTMYEMATGVIAKSLGAVLTKVIGGAAAFIPAIVLTIVAIPIIQKVAEFIFSEKKKRQVLAQETGSDAFRGWRSAIGIREVRFVSAEFEQSGTWQSRAYRLPEPVSSVSISASQSVPEGTSVRYSVSTDGANWVEVPQMGEKVSLPTRSHTLFVKIDVETSNKHVSPIIHGFLLEGYL